MSSNIAIASKDSSYEVQVLGYDNLNICFKIFQAKTGYSSSKYIFKALAANRQNKCHDIYSSRIKMPHQKVRMKWGTTHS